MSKKHTTQNIHLFLKILTAILNAIRLFTNPGPRSRKADVKEEPNDEDQV